MLLSDIAHDSAQRRPGHVALIVGEEEWTYAALSERVNRLAASLSKLIEPGDRVAVVADNCAEYIDCLYGVPQAGGIATLINQRLAEPEIEQILGDAEPRILLVGQNHLERLGDLASRLDFLERVVVFGPDGAADGAGAVAYEDFVAEADGAAPPAHRPDDESTAWLIYTSGTTGLPKGVMLSHRNIVSAMLNAMLEWDIGRDDRQLFCFPLCHVAAFVPLCYHLREATTVVMPGFDPGGVLSLLEKHRITHAGLAPTMLNMVLQHEAVDSADTSSVELIVYGGSSMPVPLLEAGIARFGNVFQQTFGQTEVSGNVVALGIEEHRRASDGEPELLSAAGRCESLALVKLVDDEMNDVPTGEIGEIVVRGDQVMQGYWRNEEATKEAIVDGWLRTGDLARMDEEGFIYIVDRKKDMVVTGGENVYPREVENVISRLDDVGEVAVFGVPDDQWGEMVIAAIVPAPDASVDADAVTEHCREQLASFKVPKRVDVRDDLPKNASMKVLKRVLREEHQTAAAGHER